MKTIPAIAALFASFTLAGALLAAQPGGKPAEKKEQPAPAKTDAPKADQPKPAETKPATQEEKLVYVKMSTSMGDIVLELNETKAPISTKNFLAYVDEGFYNGLIFHRVISNFMIQGGGFTPDMQQKKGKDPIKNEWQNGLKNAKGTIAMARTAVADSATSQFFINVVDNPALDTPRDGAAYAVFGKVVSGMDVVEKIRSVPTASKGMHQNVPKDPVTITKAERIKAEDLPKGK
jgi:cyclophilin family peptidyl-prolyl cis-trans isomerase